MTYSFPVTEESEALDCAFDCARQVERDALRERLIKYLDTIGRYQRNRQNKRKYEGRSRILVGSMIPIADAARYKRMAQMTGRSMTAYVQDALETEYAMIMSDMTM